MGTRFTADMTGNIIGYVISCGCDDATNLAPRFGDFDDATTALAHIPGGTEYQREDIRTPLTGCEMPEICPEYPLRVDTITREHAPSVELHCAHAAAVFAHLGYPDGHQGGEQSAQEFLGAVLLAQALPGGHAARQVEITHPRWTTGAQRLGAHQEHLRRLEELARWCAQRDLKVTW